MVVVSSFESSVQSCEKSAWIEHADTQIVQTCWAAMSLMYARYPDPEPVRRAVKLVMDRQLPVRPSFLPLISSNRILILSLFVGWLMAARSDRGRLQQKLCDFVSELQVLVPYLDAWESACVSCPVREEWERERCGEWSPLIL